MSLTRDAAIIRLSTVDAREARRAPADVLRIHLVNSSPKARLEGANLLAGTVNYLTGSSRESWLTNIPTFGEVWYRDVYPGIDVVYYGNQGSVEYDFVVGPGADPGAIRLSISGAERLELTEQGDLVLHTPHGEMRQARPTLYQDVGGARRAVSGGYALLGPAEVGFQVAAFDATRPLIIDPVLIYSTYLGGGKVDSARNVAIDDAGNIYLAGYTSSADFPTLNTVQATFRGVEDAFVAKLSADGSRLLYATYLGGSDDDVARDIAVDSSGQVVVTGFTASPDFPTTRALQARLGGKSDAFVVRLSADGASLTFSTYLGGLNADVGRGIALDASGNAYVVGRTASSNFPTKSPLQAKKSARSDAFVAKVSPAGSLLYSTFLGGRGTASLEQAYDVDLDPSGNVYVTGRTDSPDFPITSGAFQPVFGGGNSDAFVAKLNATGSALIFSTFFGGNDEDRGRGIAVDTTGAVYLTGNTYSSNLPTRSAFQASLAGSSDAFVAKLNATGSSLVYSSYLGSPDLETGKAVGVDADGNAYITGDSGTQIDLEAVTGGLVYTGDTEPDQRVDQALDAASSMTAFAAGFPLKDALQPTYGGGNSDAFVTAVNPSGALIYSTYLGGTGTDIARGIAVDDDGTVYVAGRTNSSDFPIKNAYQLKRKRGGDAFVTEIGR